MWIKILLLLFFITSTITSQDFWNQYKIGFDELYTKKNVSRAEQIFNDLINNYPDQWLPYFQLGIIQKNFYKNPSNALPHFIKAYNLSNSSDYNAPLYLGLTYFDLKEYNMAEQYIKYSLKIAQNQQQKTENWIYDYLCWLAILKGDLQTAKQYAYSDWYKQFLADKMIIINWYIDFLNPIRQWNLEQEPLLRITLPLDRNYQELIFYEITTNGNPINGVVKNIEGNRVFEIQKPYDGWFNHINIQFKVKQKMISLKPDNLYSYQTEAQKIWATDNRNGFYSLSDQRFLNLMESITQSGRTLQDKVILSMKYLQTHFRYGNRKPANTIYEMLLNQEGDCGYFTEIAIGMIRYLKIPVRFIYGIHTLNNPVLPHAITEIYDGTNRRWFPNDPQNLAFYGLIVPGYIPFTVLNQDGYAIFRNQDGYVTIDISQFFWYGSQKTLNIKVDYSSDSPIVHRSILQKPDFIQIPQPQTNNK
jgi:transglutaminase-like putative cysteine protease